MAEQTEIMPVDEESFGEEVIVASGEIPVLVDFSADWCGPCRVIEPVLQRIAAELSGELRVVKVDADENMRLCGRYKLRGFPTVLLFCNGDEVGRFGGARSVADVRRFIDDHLSACD
jgi:thioredoxin 1